jgi:hypothetical protein
VATAASTRVCWCEASARSTAVWVVSGRRIAPRAASARNVAAALVSGAASRARSPLVLRADPGTDHGVVEDRDVGGDQRHHLPVGDEHGQIVAEQLPRSRRLDRGRPWSVRGAEMGVCSVAALGVRRRPPRPTGFLSPSCRAYRFPTGFLPVPSAGHRPDPRNPHSSASSGNAHPTGAAAAYTAVGPIRTGALGQDHAGCLALTHAESWQAGNPDPDRRDDGAVTGGVWW